MDYKSVIESRYNRQNWQLLLHDIFGNKIKFWNTPSTIPTSSQFAKQALWLGTITLSDNQTVSIYEVELSDSVDIERNRRGIRDMLLTDWRNNGNAGAFMFCYRKNESVLRFSYVSESWNFTEDGTYKKESTDAKRFTYLLGEGHRSRTAIQQFEKLRDSSLTLKDLTKAFSVDAVSDMFFKGYKQQYEDIIFYVTGKRMVKVANKWEERQEGKPNEYIMQQFAKFDNQEKAIRDYVKKLMGRLVFLQFLQKKGWLGVPTNEPWGNGDAEFIQHLFEQCKDKDHFVDNVLEPLFNDLNTERQGDNSQLSIFNYQFKVPYLNGGLFERETADETEFPLPAKYMQSLLDFFASYNFTIDENDPDDAEVGVDPEMLGRIFENLLEDNKDKGAFYTPKEIVSYMCRESLIAYLQTDIEDEATKEAIRQFVTTHDVNALGQNQKFRQQVDEALKNVKICDPAIGSGAFPMGLLKELFQCRTALEGISQHQAAEIKKHIIQQNIYGVDIERGAVDIARLRFWLSLIVDEETPQALPNLDFKIMQGNSLLEQYKGVDLSNITELKQDKVGTYQTTMFDDMLDVLRLDLRKKLDEYYNCTDHKRKAFLKQDIINNVKQQLKEQSINVDFGDLDLSGNDQFMLWHTWFYNVFSTGGFDIVIGNPPYISATAQIANPILAKQRERIIASKNYKSLCQKWDIYIPFIELGTKQNNNNGITAMIVPFPLTNQLYARILRKMIVEENRLLELVDLNGTKIFENATVSNCIPFIQKSKPKEKTWISNIGEKLEIMKSFEQPISKLIQDQKTIIWNVTQEKRNTNRHKGMNVLGDYCYISEGMKLNADEKVARGEFTKADLISLTKDEKHSREYYEGKDIEKYFLKNRPRYLEYGTERVPLKLRRPTFPELYSNRKLMFNILGEMRCVYDDNQILHSTSIMSAVPWHELHGVENKSIASSIRKFCTMSREEMELLSQKTDLRFIMGVMNSRYASVLLTNNRGDDYHIYADYIRNIPIPSVSKVQQQPIIDLVDIILIKKKTNHDADTSALESEIDHLVYQLYGLTYDEVLIVDPETSINREEYEK
jgi:hypothetical protein